MRRCAVLAIVFCLGFGLAGAAPAAAQTTVGPPVPREHAGFQVSLLVERERFAASKSFQAVLGTSSLTEVGAGVDAGLWKGLFARVAITHTRRTGSRVIVSGSDAYSLGVPLTLTLTPVEIGAGWRFARHNRVEPYVGVAALMQHYVEQSTGADPSENTNTTDSGATLFAGIDLTVVSRFKVEIEGLYRNLPNAVGSSGAFQAFHEDNLGGGAVRLGLGVAF